MRTDAKDMTFSLAVAAFLVAASFLFFLLVHPYHLFFKEQIRLFIYTFEYTLSYLDKPGALSCFTGDFLTQFLYLRGGGAVVVSLLFLVEWIVATRVLRRFGCGMMTPLQALIPIIAEWFFFSRISYTPATSVSLILASLCFLAYSATGRKPVLMIAGVLFVPLLYCLAGAGMFLLALLVFFYEIYKRRGMLWPGFLIILIAGAYPLLVRHAYLLTAGQAYLYPSAGWQYAVPGMVMAGLAGVSMCFPKLKHRVTLRTFTFHLLALSVVFIVSLVYTVDRETEHILALASESYFGDRDRVHRLTEKGIPPHPVAAYYTNIAMSQRGELGDRLMEYYQPGASGLFLPVNPNTTWFNIFFSSDVHYYLGDMNMAQHSAMLGMIFSPAHRSSRMVKRLAEVNLALGDSTAAEKYLRMLDATLFHRKWAARMRETTTGKRPQPVTIDTIRRAEDYPAALKVLVKSDSDNRAALDYLLCYHLLNKDIPSFRSAFDTYYKEKAAYIPRVYGEALLVSLAAGKASEKEFKSYKFDTRLVKEFGEYTALYEKADGMLDPVRERFPSTYWLYYHFARMKEE
ncbi:MAG: DUF6057 family protein [Tannerellaceae bacterium]|jgi:hypothetical protein|nr:DUF6057 family protein [Tannerellaceae bacterium]